MDRAQEIRKKLLKERRRARKEQLAERRTVRKERLKKWLKERITTKKEQLAERRTVRRKKKEDLKVVKAEAKKIYDWVLHLLEEPSNYNLPDEVWLNDTKCHKIQIGSHSRTDEKNMTDKIFNPIVMKEVVKMFKAQKGYTSEYCPRSSKISGIHDGIYIRIK